MAKQIRIALGYDSFTVEGETDKTLELGFASPPVARAAFEQKLAKARGRERLAVIDATRAVDGLPPERVQLAWAGDRVTRAWVTAEEGGRASASELLAAALARPELAGVVEIGVGLELPSLDAVFDVLAAKHPPLVALALGDHDNRSGHILQLERPARIAELYPRLERLRVTTARMPAFAGVAPPELASLSLRTRQPGDLAWLVELPLRHLAISAHRAQVEQVLASPLLPRLASLELCDVVDDAIPRLLRARRDALAHLELRLPEGVRVEGVASVDVATIDRYRSSRA